MLLRSTTNYFISVLKSICSVKNNNEKINDLLNIMSEQYVRGYKQTYYINENIIIKCVIGGLT